MSSEYHQTVFTRESDYKVQVIDLVSFFLELVASSVLNSDRGIMMITNSNGDNKSRP